MSVYFLFELFVSDLDSLQPSLKQGKLKAPGGDKDSHELGKSAERGKATA